MNLQSLVKGLVGIIPGGLSLKDFSIVTQTSETLAKEILDNLMQNNIGTYQNDQIFFNEDDKLKTAIIAINMGAAIDEVSQTLNWQDFEILSAGILENRDFEVKKNIILTKPRMQIDVIGVKTDIALLIDCKHWKNMSQSALRDAVQKQIQRTKHYLTKENVRAAIPVIVTLYQNEVKFIDKVPIVPIYQLDNFCEEFYGNLEGV